MPKRSQGILSFRWNNVISFYVNLRELNILQLGQMMSSSVLEEFISNSFCICSLWRDSRESWNWSCDSVGHVIQYRRIIGYMWCWEKRNIFQRLVGNRWQIGLVIKKSPYLIVCDLDRTGEILTENWCSVRKLVNQVFTLYSVHCTVLSRLNGLSCLMMILWLRVSKAEEISMKISWKLFDFYVLWKLFDSLLVVC